MPELIGKVDYLKVGNQFCVANIVNGTTGVSEKCPIWWNLPGDPESSPAVLSIRMMHFEMLRSALETGKQVIIAWDASSGAVLNIKLLAAS